MPDPLVVPGAPGVPGAETPGQPATEALRCLRCGREVRRDDAGDYAAVKPKRRSNPWWCEGAHRGGGHAI